MPLRVRWEQHLLPINRTSGSRLQTLLRQFIYPDVPIVPSSIEQEMMELRGISLLNAASRKSELQTMLLVVQRQNLPTFLLVTDKFQASKFLGLGEDLERTGSRQVLYFHFFVSHLVEDTNPSPRARGVTSQLCHPLPTPAGTSSLSPRRGMVIPTHIQGATVLSPPKPHILAQLIYCSN